MATDDRPSPCQPRQGCHLIHDLSPIESLAIFHAAIAGVCLFLSGLISGYYDNKCLYNRIPERLQQRPFLQRLLGHERLARFSTYIGNNLGALAGNFYFGIMLGSMGTIGFISGLPLDIRHITFSSAYFSFALVGSEHQLPLQSIAISLIGIALIGLTNLLVSFALALMVALKSRRVRYRQWWPLTVLIVQTFPEKAARFLLAASRQRRSSLNIYSATLISGEPPVAHVCACGTRPAFHWSSV
jgi:site-specific recombinase